ncbi:hypothetical protein, partial [Enterococcus cecorum]|uniref:hypothetical protein n=1 Tax=Enterococcus cecorum TaxID=44008 RepID=UPI002009E985
EEKNKPKEDKMPKGNGNVEKHNNHEKQNKPVNLDNNRDYRSPQTFVDSNWKNYIIIILSVCILSIVRKKRVQK